MEEDLQGFRVGRHDDKLGDPTVERFGRCGRGRGGARERRGAAIRAPAAPARPRRRMRTLVGALAQLLIVGRLLHDVEDRVGQLLVMVSMRERRRAREK